MALTVNQALSYIRQRITLPLLRQNSAKRVLEALEMILTNYFNKQSDKLEINQVNGLQDALNGAGGSGAAFTIVPNNTVAGIQAGVSITGKSQDFWEALLVSYQAPSVVYFRINGSDSVTEEVGTVVALGNTLATWAFSNPQNVAPDSIDVFNVSSGQALALNVADTGSAPVTIPTFTVGRGVTQEFSLVANDTEGGIVTASLRYGGLLKSYFGYSAEPNLNMAGIIALGNGRLQEGKSRTVTATAGPGLYTYYFHEGPANVSSVIMDGALPVLGAFRVLTPVTGPNAQGQQVTLYGIRSNAVQAFNNNTLVFS